MMKKMMAFLLCVTALSTADVTVVNTVSGGLSLAVGNGSDHTNPGLTVCIEPIGKFSKYFGVGGHVEYAWITFQKPSYSVVNDYGAGVHFWDLSFVPKGYLPLSADMNLTGEFDPGVYMTYAYIHGNGFSDHNFDTHFGLTMGFSFNVNAFAFGFRFKSVFTDNDPTSWVSFAVGYVISGM
jgi:hypothetical protein